MPSAAQSIAQLLGDDRGGEGQSALLGADREIPQPSAGGEQDAENADLEHPRIARYPQREALRRISVSRLGHVSTSQWRTRSRGFLAVLQPRPGLAAVVGRKTRAARALDRGARRVPRGDLDEVVLGWRDQSLPMLA